MNPIPNALSHYWHLRSQGVSPTDAAAHVRQRFGVVVDPEAPLASTAEVIEAQGRRPFRAGDRFIDAEGDSGIVLEDEKDGRIPRLRYMDVSGTGLRGILDKDTTNWSVIDYDRQFFLHADSDDVPVSLGFGSEFTQTITGCGDSGRRS